MGRLKWCLIGVLTVGVLWSSYFVLRRNQTIEYSPDKKQSLTVVSEVAKGYHQIFLVSGSKREQLTHRSTNHTDPQISGQYVIWVEHIDGAGQIALYDLEPKKGVMITKDSTNLRPRLEGSRVVWERWVNDRWQVFFYDGANTKQLTDGDVSVNPIIVGNFVAFARQNNQGLWRIERLDLNTNQTVVIRDTDVRPQIEMTPDGQVK